MDTDLVFQIIITSFLAPLLVWAATMITKLANEKIASLKDQRLAKALLSATSELERAAMLSVNQVEETFVKALKAEGKFTAEDAKTAAQDALAKTKAIMSDSGMAILKTAGTDVESYIKSLIEENVVVNKPEPALVATECVVTTPTENTMVIK